MKESVIRAIRERICSGVLLGEPLAMHTTYRVGGPAEVFVSCRTPDEAEWLCAFVRSEGIPFTVIGAGSNVIAPDEGIEGIVLCTKNDSASIKFGSSGRVIADSGVMLERLARETCFRGLGGLEPLAGIPGTVGGAVVMNAGTKDVEISSFIVAVEAVDPSSIVRRFERDDLSFGYRHSVFQEPGWLVLRAEFELGAADPEESLDRIDRLIAERWQKYPMDMPSAGSVFKRPPGDYAGRLIELAGCKGMQVGGALVSERHANFIVNAGSATSYDILQLIEIVRSRVLEKTGVRLEMEQIVLRSASSGGASRT